MADQRVLPGTSSTSNISPLNPASGVTLQIQPPLMGFDAHFHPDRLESWVETLGDSQEENPRIPVKLVGGFLNFCDPTTYSKPSFRTLLEDRSSAWKITVGNDTKHASRYTELDWQAMVRHLTHSHVVGFNEIGLDFSVSSRQWGRQERRLIRANPESRYHGACADNALSWGGGAIFMPVSYIDTHSI